MLIFASGQAPYRAGTNPKADSNIFKRSVKMETEKIISLFKQYNYTPNNDYLDNKNCLVFILDSAAYPAVEIIKMKNANEEEINDLRLCYAEMGHAVHIYKEEDLCNLEDYLFNLFFNVQQENEKTQRKYNRYINELMSLYERGTDDYRYISIPYQLERDHNPEKKSGDLISSILDTINKGGPQFVIIEAAAGFGKTSTAYELLNEYIKQGTKNRPFLMELSKDRHANNFRYLLLSQIDQNFDITLKSDIVIKNIKNGRIPLIIDGFDELLSKDLDRGLTNARFEDVETMLSTIGELLTKNAKVILTTRKTAIFSGESFYDWSINRQKKSPFSISRYQLEDPSIEDWITKQELEKQNINEQDLYHIANPVLLAYLRYCSPTFRNTEHLIDQYFEFILKRERVRQDIPLSNKEQIEVYQKLSTYFSGFDITAEKRSEVRETIALYATPYLQKYTNDTNEIKTYINALTNHALLDRKDNKVGFLNDFILGYLLMESFIHYSEDAEIKDYLLETQFSFIDKSLTVAKSRSEEKKKQLWQALREHRNIPTEQVTLIDLLLRKKTLHTSLALSFSSNRFHNYTIGTEEGPLERCTFSSIEFTSCTFNLHLMEECCFIHCSFIKCEFHNEGDITVQFWDCLFDKEYEGIEESKDPTLQEDISSDDQEDNSERTEHILLILEHFFKVDKKTRKMALISRLRKEVDIDDKSLRKSINYLQAKRMIIINGDKSFITDEGVYFYFENRK